MAKDLAHILMFPWSAFGHILPFFHLSLALAKSGLKISFISTPAIIDRLPKIPLDFVHLINLIKFPLPDLAGEKFPAGSEATVDLPSEKIGLLKIAIDLLQHQLEKFVEDQKPDWIVVDFNSHWMVEIADQYGVGLIHFYVGSAYSRVFQKGGLLLEMEGDSKKRAFPNLESLTLKPDSVDFPSSVAFTKHEAFRVYDWIYGENESEISPGFDVYGNAFGLLAAHPIAPFVSLHHIDLIEPPIFPKMDRIQALKKLEDPIKFDSASLMQQSICYDPVRKRTISVSWGYAVQIVRGIVAAREMERPVRTFLHWNRWADQMGFTTNTRLVGKNVCKWPFVYALSNVSSDQHRTISEYVRHGIPNGRCRSKVANPAQIQRVEVYPDPNLWDKAPRRNCCRVMATKRKGSLAIDVGECRKDEVIEAL